MKTSTAKGIIAAGIAAILAIGLVPATASAAPATATITGKAFVLVGDLHHLVGISVNAKNTEGEVYSTKTTKGGRFDLTGLEPGTYAIKFTDTVGHVQCDGGCGSRRYYRTEWAGDATTFATAEKFTVAAGEKHSGVRVEMAENGSIKGKISLHGALVKYADRVVVYLVDLEGNRRHSSYANVVYGFAVRPGDYRLKVKSLDGEFTSFYVTDPIDGDDVFHVNGVAKQNVRIDIP